MDQPKNEANSLQLPRGRSNSVLINQEESRFLRKLKTRNKGEIKSLVWDLEPTPNANKDKDINQKAKKKIKAEDSTRKTSCCLPKRPLIIEGCVIEIIDSKGNISKAVIKMNNDQQHKEFTKTAIRKHSGEYSKAQSFFNENKEKEEVDDLNEDTKTNTIINQFAGKMEALDSGSAQFLLKKKND